MSKKRSYMINKKEHSIWIWLPLMIVFAIVPAVSYLHIYEPNMAGYSWFSTSTTATDLFLWGKATAFIILNVVMMLQVAYFSFMDGKVVKAKIFVPLLIYVGLAFLSSVISEYRDFAFSGTYEQFESIWVLLSYGMTAYYAFALLQSEKDIKCLMIALVLGATISGLIGLSQAGGNNFWATEIGKMIRIPNKELRDSVSIAGTMEETRVYMSLYNPNYVGMYAALLIPIFLVLAFPHKEDNSRSKAWRSSKRALVFVALVILCAVLVKCTIGSGSKNGFISLLAAFCILVALLVIRFRRYWYILVPMLMVPFMAFSLVNQMMDERITNALRSSFTAPVKEYEIQEISFEDDHVSMTVSGEKLLIYLEKSGKFEFKDAAGNGLAVEWDGKQYKLQDERFNKMKVQLAVDGTQPVLVVTCGREWYFRNATGKIECLSPTGIWCTFEMPEAAVFEGRESFFSGRGYIWSRTIPLLKEYIILGSGADTFTLVFPNDDYVGKYNGGYYSILITKPHNMYFQIAVQTGMLSLLAFLVFYGWYFFTSCRLYYKCRLDSFAARVGLGILIGTFGYMVSGLSNDSTVTVAPLFWGLLGIGIAINLKLIRVEALGNAAEQSQEALETKETSGLPKRKKRK